MHNLWKSKGTYLQPWQPSAKLGAELKGDTLHLTITSSDRWQGRLIFDQARHTTQLKLPADWPRINQFPEWFTVSSGDQYQLIDVQGNDSRQFSGEALLDGIIINLNANEVKKLTLIKQD